MSAVWVTKMQTAAKMWPLHLGASHLWCSLPPPSVVRVHLGFYWIFKGVGGGVWAALSLVWSKLGKCFSCAEIRVSFSWSLWTVKSQVYHRPNTFPEVLIMCGSAQTGKKIQSVVAIFSFPFSSLQKFPFQMIFWVNSNSVARNS